MRSQWWIVSAPLFVACGPSLGADGSADETTGTTTTRGDSAADDTPATTQPGTTMPTMPGTATSGVVDTGPMSTTESDDGFDSASFLDTFGDGGVAVQCDIWTQDCQDGEKCVPYSYDGSAQWSGAQCVPIAEPSGNPGDPCTIADDPFSGFDDCAAGSFCWGADPKSLDGVCYEQCTGTEASPSCHDGLRCWNGNDVVAMCVSPCSALAPTCAAHESCVVDTKTQSAFCIPAPLLTATEYGETCDIDDLSCGTGLVCAVPGSVPSCMDECCTTLCDISLPTECPDAASGQTCLPMFDRAPPGFENLGVCGIAP